MTGELDSTRTAITCPPWTACRYSITGSGRPSSLLSVEPRLSATEADTALPQVRYVSAGGGGRAGLGERIPVDNITRVSIRLTRWLSEGRLRVAGTDQLSAVFSALADPTRRAILAELAERDATVTELTAPLSISMPAVSRHLKVLERAALISRSRSGKWRASRLEAAPLREAADWIERYRRFWDSSLTRLDAHLAAVQAAGRATDRMVDDPREIE